MDELKICIFQSYCMTVLTFNIVHFSFHDFISIIYIGVKDSSSKIFILSTLST